jgi:pimeloyl-ACP methyl ester carboxylesterase
MHVSVNGTRLFFDVDGAKLVPDGPRLREKPTLILLHGGPGFDHSTYKPAFAAALADVAQIVYLDHRGQGRSERGASEHWNLPQWGDDLRAFCDALGIVEPIVLGNSFGGMVAMSYATRHPDHPGKLILSSTAARMRWARMYETFERLGGPEIRELARAFWEDPKAETLAPYAARAMPLYNRTPRDPDAMPRTVFAFEVLFHFARAEQQAMDFFPALGRIACPTLVIGGEEDPVCPIEDQVEIAAAIPGARLERFAGCGHGPFRDDPARAFAVIREFIAS